MAWISKLCVGSGLAAIAIGWINYHKYREKDALLVVAVGVVTTITGIGALILSTKNESMPLSYTPAPVPFTSLSLSGLCNSSVVQKVLQQHTSNSPLDLMVRALSTSSYGLTCDNFLPTSHFSRDTCEGFNDFAAMYQTTPAGWAYNHEEEHVYMLLNFSCTNTTDPSFLNRTTQAFFKNEKNGFGVGTCTSESDDPTRLNQVCGLNTKHEKNTFLKLFKALLTEGRVKLPENQEANLG